MSKQSFNYRNTPRASYIEGYRYVRMLVNGRQGDVPIISPFNARYMPFTLALISFNNRQVKPSGWRDQYRRWQWERLMEYVYGHEHLDLPF